MKISSVFSEYIKSRPKIVQKTLGSLPKLDKNTVSRLEIMPKEDFLAEARKLICTAREVPEQLWPAIEPVNLLYNGVRGFYDFISNTVNCDILLQTESRVKLFSTLVHEITHMKQNFDILRTKKLGKEYAKFCACIKSLIEAKFCGDDYKEAYKKNLRYFNKIRQKVIKAMGRLPFNDEKAKINYNIAKAFEADKLSDFTNFQHGRPEYEAEAYLAGKIVEKRYMSQLK